MKRAFLIILIALGLAGCKSQSPTVDPFFGRTTVPPPPTGSIAGRAADPCYQAAPSVQPGAFPANALYNQGGPTTNAPLYSGSSSWTNQANPTNSAPGTPWTNPFNTANSTPGSSLTNQSNAPRYSGPTSSALTGPSTAGAAGSAVASPSPAQPPLQNNPAPGTPPAGYSPQTPPAQPASMPSTLPGSAWPAGNRYTPPGGGFNYQGTSNGTPNPQPASPSPNRVATPFFAGGPPNRKTIPVTDSSPRPLDNSGVIAGANNPPIYNPNLNSYQNVSNPPAASTPTGIASGANTSPIGQSPVARTLQPPTGSQSYPQGNNPFSPASRQSASPAPVQPQNNSTPPAWRESTSSDSRINDDNVEPASNIEEKDGR